MSDRLVGARCARCGGVTFPPRLWCPDCGAHELEPHSIDSGVVEETTIVRRAVNRARGETRIGSVRISEDERIVAGLAPGVGAGDRARLSGSGGAPRASRWENEP